jgi:hypothetical protein
VITIETWLRLTPRKTLGASPGTNVAAKTTSASAVYQFAPEASPRRSGHRPSPATTVATAARPRAETASTREAVSAARTARSSVTLVAAIAWVTDAPTPRLLSGINAIIAITSA